MSRAPKGLLRRGTTPKPVRVKTEEHALVPVSQSLPLSGSSNVIGIVGLDSPIRDERALKGLQAQYDVEKLSARTVEALSCVEISLSEDILIDLVSDINRANASYQDAFESALDTGRCLNRIQHVIGAGGYKALLDAGVVIIGEASASKFRRIAAAIDTGRIPPDLIEYVPKNPSGAYLLSNLPRDQTGDIMRALMQQGLLPDGSIRALEQALKRIKSNGNIGDIHRELARKRLILTRLMGEVEKLKTEIDELDAACRPRSHRGAGKDEAERPGDYEALHSGQ
jgi:hypothetical protein